MNRDKMLRRLRRIGAGLVVVTVTTCSWQAAPLRLDATVQFSAASHRETLPDIGCAFVVVTSPNSSGDFSPGKAGLSTTCLPSGIASSLVSLETLEAGIKMKVTAGKSQKISVLGVPSKVACAGKTRPLELFASSETTILELGTATADLLAGAKVNVPNTYKAATAVDLVKCPTGGSTAGDLTLASPRAMIHPAENIQLTPTGGTSPYTYTLAGNGTITSNGLLSAIGPSGSTLTVTVTDSVRATASKTLPIVTAGDFLPSFPGVVRQVFTGLYSSEFGSMTLQPDGKVLLAAATKASSGSDPRLVTLIRMNRDGTVDTSFGAGGQRTYANGDFTDYNPTAIATHYEGGLLKIYVAGSAATPGIDGFVLKLNDDGSPVSGYGNSPSGAVALPGWLYFNLAAPVSLNGIGFQSNGDAIVSISRNSEAKVIVARLDPTGNAASGLLPGWGFGGSGKYEYDMTSFSITVAAMKSLMILPTDEILVAGRLDLLTNEKFGFAAFTGPGQPNVAFGGANGFFAFAIPFASYSSSRAAVLQTLINGSQRAVIVGSGQISGFADLSLAGINLNGTLDSTFHPVGAGTYTDSMDSENDQGHSVCVQTYDRKILVSGGMSNVTTTQSFIARYDENAVGRDLTFGTGGVFLYDSASAISNPTLPQIVASDDGYLFAAGDQGTGVRNVYLVGLWQ